MDELEERLLKKITSQYNLRVGAYNIRRNGKGIERQVTSSVQITPKTDKQGIDIQVKQDTKEQVIHIPVIITEGGISDVVYNDFYIGKNADVTIIAGCGIHNDSCQDSTHNGIHHFYLEEGAKVQYVEKHIGEGMGEGKRILNPQTIVELAQGAILEMSTIQIKGVDSTIRETKGILADNTNLVITEKILTHGAQLAKTVFEVELNGENASTKVTSRSIAKEGSTQQFISKIIGNSKCFGHVECDAIIMDSAQVRAIPEIIANHVDARLIHEAAIGKIAGEQVTKLMSLGLTEKEAEKQIIDGFLK